MGQSDTNQNTETDNRAWHALPAGEMASGNKVVLVAIGCCHALPLLFVYAPFMNQLFDTEPLDATAWLYCIGMALSLFLVIEIEKIGVRRLLSGRRQKTASKHHEVGSDSAKGKEAR